MAREAQPHPDFLDDGSCLGADPEVFLPDSQDRVAVNAAKAICDACKVEVACLDFAVRYPQAGVWGGKSEGQRRRIRRVWRKEGIIE